MTRLSRTSLSRLFVGGLTIASNACASSSSKPEDPVGPVTVAVPDAPATAGASAAAASVTATSSPPPPVKRGLQAYAAEFISVDSFAKAMPPGVELLGFIDIDDTGTTCSTGKCSKEWKALIVKAGAHGAVVKRSGKLEMIMPSDFAIIIGVVDSPEKAALRARLDDYRRPGRCTDFAAAGYECASPGGSGVPVRKTETGFEVVTFGSRDVCGDSRYGMATVIGIVSIGRAGEIATVENDLTKAVDDLALRHVECKYPTRGRMFEGFVDRATERSELEYFLRAAHQEAAAVVAFERLARELELYGAPRALIEEAARSAEDERRHARMFEREAARVAAMLGVTLPVRDAAPEFEPRSLRAVLEENAREGCVNETYAAVVATHQARTARDPRMRRLFAAIARDEQRHAMLAFQVHSWGAAELGGRAGIAIEESLEVATREMRGAEPSALGRAMGEPPAEVAALAFDHVAAALRAA